MNKLPGNKRILIVDDDINMRDALKAMLVKFGFGSIVAVSNVVDAKRILSESYDAGEPFDLILCDHHMPENSGLDFISYVRLSMKFRDISFITVTSDSQRAVVLPYISAGSDSFIVKPVTEKDLISKIAQVWTKRGIIT